MQIWITHHVLVHYTLYTTHDILYAILCTLHYTLYTTHYILCTIHHTNMDHTPCFGSLYTIRYSLYTIQYTLLPIHYTLYTVHFTMYSATWHHHNTQSHILEPFSQVNHISININIRQFSIGCAMCAVRQSSIVHPSNTFKGSCVKQIIFAVQWPYFADFGKKLQDFFSHHTFSKKYIMYPY